MSSKSTPYHIHSHGPPRSKVQSSVSRKSLISSLWQRHFKTARLYSVKGRVVRVVKTAERLSIFSMQGAQSAVHEVPLTVFEFDGIFILFCPSFIFCFLLSSSVCENSKKSRNNSTAATQ